MASLGDLDDDLPIKSLSISKSKTYTPWREIQRILDALANTEAIARGDLEGNFSDALQSLTDTEAKLMDLTAPARQINEQAFGRLGETLGLGGQDGSALQSLLESTPGYQFQFNQGKRAVEASASSRGLLESGALLKDLTEFGQGLASQYYGQYQTQLLSAINASTPQVQQAISGVQSLGQNRAQTQVGLGTSLSDLGQNLSSQRTSALTNLATRKTNSSSLEFDTSRGLSPDDINVTFQNLRGLI